MRKYITSLLIGYIVFSAYGNQPIVRNFTRDNYKAGTQNWAIAQNDSNCIYFANNSGLLEFDGKNWRTFPIVNATEVRSILCAKDGRIYASTFNEFGYFIKQQNGNYEYNSIMSKLGIKALVSNELYNIVEGNKKIYFQSENAIYQYDGKDVTKLNFNYKIDASAYIYNVYFVASSQSGLFMLNGSFKTKIPGSDILINKKVCSILPFGGNKLLLITRFDGVYLYDGVSISPYNTGIDDFLKKNQVFCATTNGKLLIYGTVQRGIAVQQINNRAVTYLNTYSALQNNTVLCAAFDHNQNLWLGLDKGIDYVILNTPVQNMLGVNNLYGSGYTSFLRNNTLYLGTNQGLYTCAYPLPANALALQLNMIKGMVGQIWSLTEIDNTLFCGCDQGAFVIYTDHIERIIGLKGTWGFTALKKHPDIILGCSYRGLFTLKKTNKKWEFAGFVKGKFKESNPMFEEDRDGTVWLSHWQKGLFHLYFNEKMDSVTRVDLYNQKNGLPSNRNNTLYRIGNNIIFSTQKGFYVYDRNSRKMKTATEWNQLFRTIPSDMRLHETKNGDVWSVSGRFIGLAKKKQGHTYTMDSLSYRILQSKLIIGFEHFYSIDKTNQIIGTNDGFSWVNSQSQIAQKDSFKVFVKNVYISNTSSPDESNNQQSEISKLQKEYSHQENSLLFEFVAPEFRAEDVVQYSYLLENWDKDWSPYGAVNKKLYTNLPKGDYVFKIRAHNMLDSKESYCSYSFTILPTWYQSKLAYTFYFLLLILSIILIRIGIKRLLIKRAATSSTNDTRSIQNDKKVDETESDVKKKEGNELNTQQLQHELRHKSQELAYSTMNLLQKNEIMMEIMENIAKASEEMQKNGDFNTVLSRFTKMERKIKLSFENDDNWKKFEENFDLVYENYLKRLTETFPHLNVGDKKLCAYLKMDLSSKEIAPLLNMSVRSVETNRYRLRKKLNIDRDMNLSDFLQKF